MAANFRALIVFLMITHIVYKLIQIRIDFGALEIAGDHFTYETNAKHGEQVIFVNNEPTTAPKIHSYRLVPSRISFWYDDDD